MTLGIKAQPVRWNSLRQEGQFKIDLAKKKQGLNNEIMNFCARNVENVGKTAQSCVKIVTCLLHHHQLGYWIEHKTKNGNKNTATEYRYFLESNFVGLTDCLFWFIQM